MVDFSDSSRIRELRIHSRMIRDGHETVSVI